MSKPDEGLKPEGDNKSPEHYYPVMGNEFKNADTQIEVIRPTPFKQKAGTVEYGRAMAITDNLQPESFGEITDVRKSEKATPEVRAAAVDMLEDATRLAITRLAQQEVAAYNKVGGIAHREGGKIDDEEHSRIFVSRIQKLRGAAREVASNAQKGAETSELGILTKVEIIAKAIEAGHTEYSTNPENNLRTQAEVATWDQEQQVKTALAKQLRTLAVKEMSDRMVEAVTGEYATKDIRWGAETAMDTIVNGLEQPGLNMATAQEAVNVLKKFNSEDSDQPASVKFGVETSALAKRIMNERQHTQMEEGAHSEQFRGYLSEHLGPGRTLVDNAEHPHPMKITGGNALERITNTESLAFGADERQDIGTIGTTTLEQNIVMGFAYSQFEKGKLKMENDPSFNKRFVAEVAREFEPGQNLNANVALVRALENMGQNFNKMLEKDAQAGKHFEGDQFVTNEETVRMAALIIGRRAALRTNPGVDLDSRINIFSVATTAPTKAAELTADLSRSLEFFDQKLTQAQNTDGELPDNLRVELSYGYIALAQSLQECDKKWGGDNPAELAVFPAIVGGGEVYNDKDPLMTPIKKAKAPEPKKQSKLSQWLNG